MATVTSGINSITDFILIIGDGTSVDGYIYINNASPSPYLRHDTSGWKFSNDGSTENSIGEVTSTVDPTIGGTGQTTYTTGDILYASAANTLSKLGIGSQDQILSVNAGGIPEWIDATSGGSVTNYDTVSNCKAAGEPELGSLCYIQETKSFYQYVTNVNDSDNYAFIEPAGASISNRWVPVGGRLINSITYLTTSTIVENYSTVAFGYNVLNEGTDGVDSKYYVDSSILIGRDVGAALTSTSPHGDRSVVIGDQVYSTTAGFEDLVAIGYLVGSASGSTGRNVFIGAYAAEDCVGTESTIVGYQAGRNCGDSDYSVYIGSSAGRYATGNNNCYIGYSCGTGASGSSTATSGTFVGYSAGINITTGSTNTLIGTYAGRYLTTSQGNIAIGYNSMSNLSQTSGIDYCIAIGHTAGDNMSGDMNIAIGRSSMTSVSGTGNIGIGYQAGITIGAGVNNTLIGYQSGAQACVSNNTCLGYQAGWFTGSDNCFIGYRAAYQAGGVTNSVAIGSETGRNLDGTGHVLIGHHAGYSLNTGGARNIAVGYEALNDAITSSDNIAIGYQASRDINTTGTSYSVSIGTNAAQFTDGIGGIYIGYYAGRYTDTDGDYNIAIGYGAMECNTSFASAQYNIALGYQALNIVTSGNDNIAIGRSALDAATTGSQNIAIGAAALSAVTDSQDNIAIGANAGNAISSGNGTIAIGRNCLQNITTQSYMIGIGNGALAAATINVDNNIAVGYNALSSANGNATNGYCRYNTAIGYDALGDINATTGDQTNDSNTAVGYQAMYLTPGVHVIEILQLEQVH